MSDNRHLEVLKRGPISVVRVLNHGPLQDEEANELACEWKAVAAGADCHTLVVDFSTIAILRSEMLSALLSLQRRLKQKNGRLVLCGVRGQVREVFRWTKLDGLFEVDGNDAKDVINRLVGASSPCEESLCVPSGPLAHV